MNESASEMGKLRWKGKTKKQKREHALMMVEKRRNKATDTSGSLTKEQK